MYTYYTPALLHMCSRAHNATRFLFTRFDSHKDTIAVVSLTIRVISASNLASSSFVGKVNPFAIIKIGTQEQQTKVVQDGGKKPVWGDTFDFSISTEKELNLRVMDKADVGQPKFIGHFVILMLGGTIHKILKPALILGLQRR